MKEVVLFPHVGSANHGCEAIVRSTSVLFENYRFLLFSNHPDEDIKYNIQNEKISVHHDNKEVVRFTGQYFGAIFRKYILQQGDAFYRATFLPVLKACSKTGIMLSIGGDQYCYDPPEFIYKVNQYVREKKCKTVLWGCSVEPTYIDERMRNDLRQYDLICARESITYHTLKAINPNTILSVDPAFVLPPEEVELPAKHFIGINVSPMILERESTAGITLRNYKRLISYILKSTSDSVALIPHVVWSKNDDREPLKALKAFFEHNDRVILVDDHNAVQQKYIIAHCRLFIGARTHATIAAYSSCVPTLVVGYSVKAKGIAKDLFGRYEDYVLPVQSIEHDDDLVKSFCWLIDHENEIRAHLHNIMPEYIGRTKYAVDAVLRVESGN